MKSKPRAKMTVADRAKQFAPFSALRGLSEALRQMERVVVPRAELSEERMEEINRTLQQLEKGMMLTAVYFSDGEYVKITGKLARLDTAGRWLQLVDTKIAFDDLYALEVEA